MVSVFKRHLSLFLVVISAMSWFVVPNQIFSTPVASAQNTGSTSPCPPLPANTQVNDARQILGTNTASFTKLPIIQHVCFYQSGNTIVHRFYYVFYSSSANSPIAPGESQAVNSLLARQNIVYELKLQKQGAAYGYCRTQTSNQTNCPPNQFDSFSARPDVTGTVPGSGSVPQITQFSIKTTPIDVYSLGFDNTYLLVYKNLAYGYYQLNGTTYQRRTPNITAQRNQLVYNYITQANNLARPTVIFGAVGDGSGSEGTREATRLLFGSVSGANLSLIDDPAATNKSAPELPPLVLVQVGGQAVTFKLVAARSVEGQWYGLKFWGLNRFRVNNFFIFKLQNPTPQITALLGQPDKVHLAIDLAGNVVFLVEDTSKAGGIFTGSKDTLDQLIVLGNASGDDREASTNLAGQVLAVGLEQYKTILTRRVYNEAAPRSNTEDKACDKVVNYPDLNTTYDQNLDGMFAQRIPDPDHAKCLNLSENGWLAKWGVSRGLLNAPDECQQAFTAKRWGLYKFLITPLCGLLNLVMSGSVWLTNLSIGFLIETAGLQ